MIRVCIQCKHIFGCQAFDSPKRQCKDCRHYSACTTRVMINPPVEQITGGICDFCFERIVIPRHKKYVSVNAS